MNETMDVLKYTPKSDRHIGVVELATVEKYQRKGKAFRIVKGQYKNQLVKYGYINDCRFRRQNFTIYET